MDNYKLKIKTSRFSKKTLALNFIFCFVVMLFIGCSSNQEVEFEKSTGTINKIKSNSRFFINLSESHKVGSGLWSVNHDYDDKIINYLGSSYKSDDGGSVTFNFESFEKGKTEINLTQSFAGETLQTSTFVVEVE